MKKLLLVLLIAVNSYSAFIKSGDIVKDTETGLVFEDKKDIQYLSWNDAIKYCGDLKLNGHNDWRLPNRKELTTIVDKNREDISIKSSFENVEPSSYWSSSTYASNDNSAWVVYFSNGYLSNSYKGYGEYVRCVRDAD
jgi:hypothetical protein